MIDKARMYCVNKKMFPFFSVEEIQEFIKTYYQGYFIKIVKIKEKSIDPDYRIDIPSYIALFMDDGELNFIDQDGCAFLLKESKEDTIKFIQKHFENY